MILLPLETIKKMVKKIIKKIFKKLGYEIIKSNNLFLNNKQCHKPAPFYDQKFLIGDNKGIVVFDVGAHHGQTAVIYNRLFNNCRIYSFEPFIESFNILNETVRNEKNIETFNLALGNIVGEVNFHVNKYSATSSILPTHQEGSNTWGENLLDTLKTIKVNSTTIDDFIEKKGINQIDILKLDTQGTEYSIIEGAKKAIKKGIIKIIYLEIITLPTYQGQKQFDEVLKLLRLNGFRLYNVYDYSFTQFGELRQIDTIFIRNSFQFNDSKNNFNPTLRRNDSHIY